MSEYQGGLDVSAISKINKSKTVSGGQPLRYQNIGNDIANSDPVIA